MVEGEDPPGARPTTVSTCTKRWTRLRAYPNLRPSMLQAWCTRHGAVAAGTGSRPVRVRASYWRAAVWATHD